VHAGHDDVKRSPKIVILVAGPVIQEVHFDAREASKSSQPARQAANRTSCSGT